MARWVREGMRRSLQPSRHTVNSSAKAGPIDLCAHRSWRCHAKAGHSPGWPTKLRKVHPNRIADALERAVFESVRDDLVRKVGNIRDPETGARPKLRMVGRSMKDLSINIEGSPALIEEVKRRLGS